MPAILFGEGNMSDDYNSRAAKGQAFNLAVALAIKEGKAYDTVFIYAQYLRFFELGQLIQEATHDQLRQVIGESK